MEEIRNSIDNEERLMGILLNSPELIDRINFRKEYFSVPEYSTLFELLKKYRAITNNDFIKSLGDNLSGIMVQLMVGDVHSEETRPKMSVFYAIEILRAYKAREKERLDVEYKEKRIEYDEYFYKLGDLEKLSIIIQEEDDTEDDLIELCRTEDVGLSIPRFPRLSNALKAKKGDVVTFAGKSGFGKSALLLNLYQSMSQSGEYKCHYFNLEVSTETMKRRLISITSDIALSRLQELAETTTIKDSVHKIVSNDSHIYSGSSDLERLKAIVTQNMSKDKTNVVFVDHVGLLQISNKNIKTEYDRVTYVMQQLRAFALDNDILLIMASQFDRSSIKTDSIGMHSLKSSGEIENSSTHVIIMKDSDQYPKSKKMKDWTDDELYLMNVRATNQLVNLSIEKNRNGSVGVIEDYKFFKVKQTFEEPE